MSTSALVALPHTRRMLQRIAEADGAVTVIVSGLALTGHAHADSVGQSVTLDDGTSTWVIRADHIGAVGVETR